MPLLHTLHDVPVTVSSTARHSRLQSGYMAALPFPGFEIRVHATQNMSVVMSDWPYSPKGFPWVGLTVSF